MVPRESFYVPVHAVCFHNVEEKAGPAAIMMVSLDALGLVESVRSPARPLAAIPNTVTLPFPVLRSISPFPHSV